MKYQFSEEEKAAVEKAVKELEVVSCGEMVPYFVNRSDSYGEASWMTGLLAGAITAVSIATLSFAWMMPFQVTPIEVTLVELGAILLGFLFPIVWPSAIRWIVPDQSIEQRVQDRAMRAFLDEGVYKTEEHVGILIFISWLEHRVLVLGDEGINAKLQPEDWQKIVDTIVQGIKQKDLTPKLIDAINDCKRLLLDHGFVRKSTDYNELSDELRLGED